MKFDNKTFQQKYEAWKNGADYWKDIRGINLGGDTQAEEPSPEEQLQMDQNVQSILNAYNEGKDANIAEDIVKPLPFDTPLNEEHPILHKYKGGKNDSINTFVHRMGPLVGQQLSRYGYGDAAYYNVMRQLAYESNYGRSRVARQQHNYGGVGWNGKTYNTYKSDADFVKDYVRLMHTRYGEALRAKSTQDYARALKKKGYYEDSLENYSRNLRGMDSLVKAAHYHRNAHKDAYNYNVQFDDLVQDYEDAKNASPIIINSPSTRQPSTIRADVPATLLGPTQEEIKAQQQRDLDQYKQQMYDKITQPSLPNILNLLPQNNFGKDSYGQKFWLRRGNNLHFKYGKDNLPKFIDGDDGNTFGGNIAKALGAGEIGQEIANFGTQMIPVVGTYYDWKTAVNDPSIENIGMALMTTAGDVFTLGAGGMAIRAGLRAAKAAAKYKKAMDAYNTAKTLVPGTKQVTRAIRVAGNAADEARIAAQRHKAIKNIKNSTKAIVATHLTDAKDLYERVKKHYNKK